jgi:hypothetical protein
LAESQVNTNGDITNIQWKLDTLNTQHAKILENLVNISALVKTLPSFADEIGKINSRLDMFSIGKNLDLPNPVRAKNGQIRQVLPKERPS